LFGSSREKAEQRKNTANRDKKRERSEERKIRREKDRCPKRKIDIR